ncbi:MAG TPA: tetratricopeptide repeat protein, partial [Aggregatilineales bacterium]|nr:tetratricopeptide repeat protein [Aggregatilineales bacterium]
MAEITLNRYLAKLEALQKQGLHHEVSLHARHILEKYPKNAAAHRLLAHALLAANQHDEAEHEFRRVLSAYPDDADPYMGLSRIAAFHRRYDEAIGYAERAADLKPGDADIARALRDMYADQRGIRDARIPQGAYTLALQQRRAGLLNRAVDTLKAAVAQHPERIDLRVLLAEIHWDNESPIEAAELAIEILKGLPNCLSANRVLTQLCLIFARTDSDALTGTAR